MPRTIEDITRDLSEVAEELLAIEAGDFKARFDLLTRRDRLRIEAEEFHTEVDAGRPTADIIQELTAARKARDAALARQSGRALASTGATGAASSATMLRLTARANREGGLEALETRVGVLESILAQRNAAQTDRSNAPIGGTRERPFPI